MAFGRDEAWFLKLQAPIADVILQDDVNYRTKIIRKAFTHCICGEDPDNDFRCLMHNYIFDANPDERWCSMQRSISDYSNYDGLHQLDIITSFLTDLYYQMSNGMTIGFDITIDRLAEYDCIVELFAYYDYCITNFRSCRQYLYPERSFWNPMIGPLDDRIRHMFSAIDAIVRQRGYIYH